MLKLRTDIPEKVARAIAKLLDHVWDDERRHFEARDWRGGMDTTDHIFRQLWVISDWLGHDPEVCRYGHSPEKCMHRYIYERNIYLDGPEEYINEQDLEAYVHEPDPEVRVHGDDPEK